MPLPRLLVFDLDGTLIDSSLDLCNSVNATLEHMRRPPLPNALIATFIGEGASMLVRRALGDPGDLDASTHDDTILRKALEFFLTYYRQHKLDHTVAYDGVHTSLQAIRDRHPQLPMAVLTNKPVRPSREICEALGLAPFFFQNYGGDSFETKKPDPLGLQTLMDEAAALLTASGDVEPLRPGEVVMIGDSDVDITTARRIGVRSIGCLYGLAPNTLLDAQPELMVLHPSQWPGILGL